ncbi:hypothetical protein BDW69DRAFT_180035 [Aspergillus filifer]
MAEASSSSAPPNQVSSGQEGAQQKPGNFASARETIFGNCDSAYIDGATQFLLEVQDRRLSDFKTMGIWTALGKPGEPSKDDFWLWCTAVVRAVTPLRSQPLKFLTIEDATKDVLTQLNVECACKTKIAIGMITTISWLLSAGVPGVKVTDSAATTGTTSSFPSFDPLRVMEEAEIQVNFDIAGQSNTWEWTWGLEQSVLTPFLLLARTMPQTSPANVSGDDDLLVQASLSYASLHKFGALDLEWVDSLEDHLVFDKARHKLRVYKYPSICALRISNQDSFIFDRVALTKRNFPWYRTSYIDRSVFDNNLLAPPMRGQDNQIRERPTYSANIHFPVYGKRLVELQKFGNLNPPVTFIDYCLDPRFTRELYTARGALFVATAAVCISTLSFILGVIALGHAIAHYQLSLAEAAKPPQVMLLASRVHSQTA